MNGQQVRDKLTESVDERGVSLVIGVILMVAITVILAAVIAAFVMGIGPGGEALTASADISGSQTSSVDIAVTESGEADKLVIVDPDDGSIAAANSDISTGANYNVVAAGGDFTVDSNHNGGSLQTGYEYDVYAITGSAAEGDPLESAEGTVSLGSFQLS
ncbi:type IV pilin [Halovivax limisalsi]|uniref:type IV pilin n=1 Tax=Halovivax limisalsi TaxID=1453760 RepID=UPI001FFD8F36|nr:type IV pilin N-terminal domain-containing protein [Halovivax limisalsi]